MSLHTLNPCPFCGKVNTVELIYCEDDRGENFNAAVNCNALKNGCGAKSGFADSFEAAVNKWNTRAEFASITVDSNKARRVFEA